MYDGFLGIFRGVGSSVCTEMAQLSKHTSDPGLNKHKPKELKRCVLFLN